MACRRCRAFTRSVLALGLLFLFSAIVGGCNGAGPGDAGGKASVSTIQGDTDEFLKANLDRYADAVRRIQGWLDELEVDPLALREHGIKGKKKLAEIVWAYQILYGIVPEHEKPAIIDRVKELVAITYQPEYHDMAAIDDEEFTEDSTSYLRVAYLMDKLGLDTELYSSEIAKIHWRLNEQMPSRGPHQREAFHIYYSHFGLAEPFALENSISEGVIANREPLQEDSGPAAYSLTHEVLVKYDFGDLSGVQPFSEADVAYIGETATALLRNAMEADDADLAAELVVTLRLVGLERLPEYREGLAYLLANQNPDGSFGDYEHLRPKYGAYVDQGWYLHTTVTALLALVGFGALPSGV